MKMAPPSLRREFASVAASGRRWPIQLSAGEMKILQDKILSLNTGYQDLHKYSKFNIDNVTYGYMQPKFVDTLMPYKDVFSIKEIVPPDGTSARCVELHPSLLGLDLHGRSAAVATVLQDLRSKGLVRGWRDELFPIVKEFGDPNPALLIERACYPWFGIRGYGLHVNGYTVSSRDCNSSSINGGGDSYISHYWVAKRSRTKSTFPGALDSIVAGAIPFGVSSLDNVVKECIEEARIPAELSREYCIPTGCVNYIDKDSDGNLKRDFLFCFDFKTPASFTPEPNDGEVESFRLMTLEWLIEEILKVDCQDSTYKPNCVIIIVDFLIRRGIISPDSPGYFKLVQSLHSLDST